VPHTAYDEWHLVLLRMSGQVAFPTAGLLIAARRPANPLGWLLLLFGLSLGANEFLRVYAEYTLLYRPGALPGGLAIAWVSTWTWAFIYPILPFVLLLFPMADCRLTIGVPSPGSLALSTGCFCS
jgi:two-component system NarL family sensor kinase